MDLNLKDKVVVVTGGSKGIGFAIAKEFLAEGAEVFITGRNLESLEKAEQELSVYGKLHGIQGDGTVLAEIQAVAAKAALLALTKTTAGEYASKKIRVNAVLPGYTKTPLLEQGFSEKALERLLQGNLLRRMANPEEIAKPVVFLSSDAASYINGEAIEVTGGHNIVLNPWQSYEN